MATTKMLLWVTGILAAGCVSLQAEEITTDNGLDRGDWGDLDSCPMGTYVFAFELKYAPIGALDDEAATGVRMYCRSDSTTLDGTLTSEEGKYGYFRDMKSCAVGSYFKGFRLNVVEEQGNFRDDMGVDNVQVICEDDTILDGMNDASEKTADYGDWGTWAYCSAGQRVCGLQTRIEPEQVTGDDAGMVDMKLDCCAV
ncbi:unnamed protein product [Meganyctiphanes norvegica]|uniref:Vitelline membrane outer layer protein 1 n=1 Tax=Meganyctiphanes norvegica TaxID=48144 RepID=A0AAV2QDL7_MEGNR